jgi:hypothetical protein
MHQQRMNNIVGLWNEPKAKTRRKPLRQRNGTFVKRHEAKLSSSPNPVDRSFDCCTIHIEPMEKALVTAVDETNLCGGTGLSGVTTTEAAESVVVAMHRRRHNFEINGEETCDVFST